MDGDSNKTDKEAIELVSFSIGTQLLCIDIQSVREIRGWSEETTIPSAPDYVRGFINLRGTIVPIVDLAARLEMVPTEPTARSVIIVIHINEQLVGLLVHSVSDILTVAQSELQPTPEVASDYAKMFVRGVLASDGGMLTMIETRGIFPPCLAKAA